MVTRVRDVMTESLTAVAAEASVTSVARTMRDQDIGLVLVRRLRRIFTAPPDPAHDRMT